MADRDLLGGDVPRKSRPRSREPLSLFPETLRWCSGCRQKLAREAFSSAPKAKDGLRSRCKQCLAAAAKAHYAKGGFASHAAKHLRRTYGISSVAFAAMVEAQGNLCAICAQEMGQGKNRHVDHCHATGVVRALLCNGCNTAIGQAREDPALLRAMADYIEGHLRKDAM